MPTSSRSPASCVSPRKFASVEYRDSRAGRNRQPVGFAVFYHLLATGEAFDELRIAPRRIDLDIRVYHIRRKLDAYLIIASPGSAVEQDADAALSHMLENRRHGNRTRDARRIPVSALIPRLRLDHAQPRLRQRGASRNYDRIRRPASDHAVRDSVQVLLIRLPQVHRKRLDFKALLRKPVRNRAAIQPAGDGAAKRSDVLVGKFAVVQFPLHTLSRSL